MSRQCRSASHSGSTWTFSTR